MNNSRLAHTDITEDREKRGEEKGNTNFFLLLLQLSTNFDYHHIYYMIMFFLFFSYIEDLDVKSFSYMLRLEP